MVTQVILLITLIMMALTINLAMFSRKLYNNNLITYKHFNGNDFNTKGGMYTIEFSEGNTLIGMLNAITDLASNSVIITNFEFYPNRKHGKGTGYGHVAIELLKVMIMANTPDLHTLKVKPHPIPGYDTYNSKKLQEIYSKLGFKPDEHGEYYVLEIKRFERIKIHLYLLTCGRSKNVYK